MTGSGRRPIVRWAVRMFRRELRQQLVVLLLLTVAVGAAVAGVIVAVTVTSTADSAGELGSASALAQIEVTDTTATEASVSALRDRFGDVDVIAHIRTTVPGSSEQLDVRDQAADATFGGPMLHLVRGRYPSTTGEVALTSGAADTFAASIGTTIEVGDGRLAASAVTVVGIVENPSKLSDEFVLVAPGSIATADVVDVLLHFDDTSERPADVAPGNVRFRLAAKGDDRPIVVVSIYAAATVALSLVGLIAAAGFVVLAQRRQRQLGLLAAIGATDRHVRLVMIANGVLVGIAAAMAGTVVGIATWFIAAPAVERAADHRLGRFDLPVALIAGLGAMAIVAATAAAWWPARTTTRLPVVAALSGRPARPQPIHRSLLVAIALGVGGVLAIGFSHPGHEDARPVLLMFGLIAVVLGSIFATPAAINRFAALAPRLPFAPRLALRDLGRFQARAAASLAAITLSLSIAVSLIVIAALSEPAAGSGNLSRSEMLIRIADENIDPGLTDAQLTDLDARAATVADAMGSGQTAVPLDLAFGAGSHQPVALLQFVGEHEIQAVTLPYLATPELLALYGIDESSIDAATDVLTNVADKGYVLSDVGKRPDPNGPRAVLQGASLPRNEQAPNALITSAAIERNGWATGRVGWIVESPHALSSGQIRAARAAAAAAGLQIEVREVQDGPAAVRNGATLVGVLMAMAIVAMAVGLIRSESARDIRTLTATGAGALTRRAMTASTAAALAIPGVVLGTAGAYVGMIAAFHDELDRLTPIPFGNLLWIAVGLPLIVTVLGWLLGGREPKTIARRALD